MILGTTTTAHSGSFALGPSERNTTSSYPCTTDGRGRESESCHEELVPGGFESGGSESDHRWSIESVQLIPSDGHPYGRESIASNAAERRPIQGEPRSLFITDIPAIEQCVFLLWPSLVRWPVDRQSCEITPGWWIRCEDESLWRIHAIETEMVETQLRCGCFKWSSWD